MNTPRKPSLVLGGLVLTLVPLTGLLLGVAVFAACFMGRCGALPPLVLGILVAAVLGTPFAAALLSGHERWAKAGLGGLLVVAAIWAVALVSPLHPVVQVDAAFVLAFGGASTVILRGRDRRSLTLRVALVVVVTVVVVVAGIRLFDGLVPTPAALPVFGLPTIFGLIERARIRPPP